MFFQQELYSSRDVDSSQTSLRIVEVWGRLMLQLMISSGFILNTPTMDLPMIRGKLDAGNESLSIPYVQVPTGPCKFKHASHHLKYSLIYLVPQMMMIREVCFHRTVF